METLASKKKFGAEEATEASHSTRKLIKVCPFEALSNFPEVTADPKEVETMSVPSLGTIEISLDEDVKRLESQGLALGITIAIEIISSEVFVTALLSNISDAEKTTSEQVRLHINACRLTLKVIEIGEHMDAYALVYRSEDPAAIYFNPLLLLNFAREERRDPSSVKLHAIFLGVKIMHEFAHLIHPVISADLKNSVLSKSIGGGGKRKMKTPQKSKGGAMFDDYGEMLEYDLVGGIMELHGSSPIAFSCNNLILYPHVLARQGRLVVPVTLVLDRTLAALRLETREDFVDKAYTGQRGHLASSKSTRFSNFSDIGDSDVIDIEVFQVDESESGIPEPTF